MSIDRKAAAGVLRSIAALLELHDENPDRVPAFANAARTVERVEWDLAELVSGGCILDIGCIGRGTAAALNELLEGRTPSACLPSDSRTSGGKPTRATPALGSA